MPYHANMQDAGEHARLGDGLAGKYDSEDDALLATALERFESTTRGGSDVVRNNSTRLPQAEAGARLGQLEARVQVTVHTAAPIGGPPGSAALPGSASAAAPTGSLPFKFQPPRRVGFSGGKQPFKATTRDTTHLRVQQSGLQQLRATSTPLAVPPPSSRKRSRHSANLDDHHYAVMTVLSAAVPALQSAGMSAHEAAVWLAESGSLCLASQWA